MEIQLSQGKIALIDDDDATVAKDYGWYAARSFCGKRWYAIATTWDPATKRRSKVKLHRVIVGAKPGEMVDHINGDTMDCRRSNLRICTNAENQQNSGPRGGRSRYKGVSWVSAKKKWRVAFRWNGQHHDVGYFRDELEAARAYNDAVTKIAGEFARPNAIAA